MQRQEDPWSPYASQPNPFEKYISSERPYLEKRGGHISEMVLMLTSAIYTDEHTHQCIHTHNSKLISTYDLHKHWALMICSPNPVLQNWVDLKALPMLPESRGVEVFSVFTSCGVLPLFSFEYTCLNSIPLFNALFSYMIPRHSIH